MSPDEQSRIIAFAHPAFAKFENLLFRLSAESGEPVAVVSLGQTEAALPLRGIRREFAIADDSPDGRMLDLVVRGLDFVKALHLGEALPSELFSRKASWKIAERHKRIAHQRLTMQMVSWLYGEEHLITSPEELAQVADDPQTRRRVSQAFEEVAERLGIGRERKEEVVGHIEVLSDELAYIEALRDLFQHILSIDRKLQALRKVYAHEKSVLEVADPVARLTRLAVDHYRDKFDECDAQTGEILNALKNIDAHINYIRAVRDDLHMRLMAWEELVRDWSAVKAEASPKVPDLIRRTYRFLAPRFMPVNEWVLVSQMQGKPIDARGKSLLASPAHQKNIGKVMKW